MSDIRAVVSDLDGTLWWGRSEVHPTTLPAIEELTARGVDLLFATGRRRASATRGLEPLGLLGPAVLLSGALGVDLTSGEEWHRQAFSPEDAHFVITCLADHGLSPVVHISSDRVDSIIGPDVTTCAAHLEQFDQPHADGLQEVLDAGVVVGFGMCGLEGADARALYAVADLIGGRVNAYCGPDHIVGGTTLMIAPRGISKVAGIEGWMADRGVTADQVLAVGDGANDVEMLAWAGTSVAVRGDDAERAGADHVIPHPRDGGWAQLLDLL